MADNFDEKEKIEEAEDVKEQETAAGVQEAGEEASAPGAKERCEDEESKEEEQAEAEEAEGTESEEEGKKKGFFGKEKKEKKDKKDLKIEELTDQYRRTLAEFDNYRKRTDKEKSAMFEVGAKSLIEKILPVVDSFERGLATVPEEEKGKPFADGMDKIYKQLIKQLEEAGVKEIEAMDKEFDPNFHNAVMHVEDENAGENIIVEVFQKGYTYHDSVVRHSMVKVAN